MSDEVLKEEHMDTHDEEGNDEVVMRSGCLGSLSALLIDVH